MDRPELSPFPEIDSNINVWQSQPCITCGLDLLLWTMKLGCAEECA